MDNPRIIVAEQEAVDQFPKEVDRIVAALGIKWAITTDLSQVADFLPPMIAGMDKQELLTSKTESDEKLNALKDLVGRNVLPSDYIWELARDLYLREEELRSQERARARPN